ncbi:MAG TPA: PfkB family carbohydrate kinase [Baekduia sp.]|uniref:PfkB family carbohydrate kinase n=1 Tax=Baekduia sp. TaxID=2600305 RepID=UPI002D791D4D|nr:PfkB family carbohydrate kinase [Baekduia sp.]HET6507844.1 PfkB family carbohydrate kinase [Baekduia sp.]
MPEPRLLTLGRANLDLYAQQHGVAFADAIGWDAMVGGSPVNVALAAARLGVRAGVLTAVGADLVGDWVLRALTRQGVDTRFVARKAEAHTSLALRAQVAPDHPLAFYRHDPADIHLTADDLAGAPVERVPAVLVSADALARGTTAAAARSVLARARGGTATVYLDLDLREVSWPGGAAYARAVGAVVTEADVILGTEEEFATLLGLAADADAAVVAEAVRALSESAGAIAVLKRGAEGAAVLRPGREPRHVPAFDVAEASTVGAGDSFAAGLIAARLNGSDWAEAGRFAGACAAITVSRFGCSTGFPHLREVSTFLRTRPALTAMERS